MAEVRKSPGRKTGEFFVGFVLSAFFLIVGAILMVLALKGLIWALDL